MSTTASPRRWLTQQEAAEQLGVDTRTLRRYISDGSLRAHRVAGKRIIRIDQADLDNLLKPIPTTSGGGR